MKILLCFCFCALLAPFSAFGDLSDFKSDVEEAEKDQDETSQSAEDQENEPNFFGELAWAIVRWIWVTNNTTTTYGDYPYEPDGYVRWAEWEEDPSGGEDTVITMGKRDQWFTTEVQGLSLSDMGLGGWFAFKGHLYRFFGPYFEGWSLYDGTDYLNGLRLGITFALFQSELVNLSLYTQWNHWWGILNRDGQVLGLEFRSYPFKPLALQLRAGFQVFSAFKIGEWEAQAGWLLDRVEIFGGWRQWSLNSDQGLIQNLYQGPFGGIRVYY